MRTAACIDEAINRVHIEICIFSRFIDISEMLSWRQSWFLMFWTSFRVYSGFPRHDVSAEIFQNYTLGFQRHTEQSTIRILNFFLPMSTPWESLVLTWVLEITRRILSHQIRFDVKRDNMLLLSPLVIQAKRFPDILFDISDRFPAEKKRMDVGKVAARKCGVVHDVKKMQQIVPLIKCELAFC